MRAGEKALVSRFHKLLFGFLILQFLGTRAFAQFDGLEKTIHTPLDPERYIFPINPGQPNWLAGTMGELRNTHFHAGIDIRTNNQTGMPVRATQKGYVSRVIVGTYGYGQAVFVTHPDGNVSVYGHLDKFYGKLGAHVLNEHYKRQSFDLDLKFSKDQFPVTKGDTIALSGNTGGSQGPHLHFELRDSANYALNPLVFGFDEIKDNMAPVAQKIAFKTLEPHARINGQFGRKEYYLSRRGNVYTVPQPVNAIGKIGIELLAFDRLDFSQFRCGINEIEMWVDSVRVFVQRIDKIDLDETRRILTLMNFQTLKSRGLRFNKLHVDDGSDRHYYDESLHEGEIDVKAKAVKVVVKLKDTYGNESQIRFQIIPGPRPYKVNSVSAMSKPMEWDIFENVMQLKVRACHGPVTLFENGASAIFQPDYEEVGSQVFLIDLQKNLPDSIQTCNGMLQLNFKDRVPSGIEYTFYSEWANIHFPVESLYDTLFFQTDKKIIGNREVYTIGNPQIPLHESIEITLKREGQASLRKTSAYHQEGRSYKYLGGEWTNGAIKFTAPELGEFVLLKDSLPPSINRIYCTRSTARFRISDTLSGIGSFEATINGEWLLMKYDYKTGILQSEKLDYRKPLVGEFVLKVTDREGNERIYKQRIL